jgi:cytochrome oxidase Cu insertion factor (SCO1/SenC/PrrC family)
MTSRKLMVWLGFAVLVLAACAPAATPTVVLEQKPTEVAIDIKPTEVMDKKPTEAVTGTKPAEAARPTPQTIAQVPAWFSIELTDARSGAAFKFQDFKGKVVLVENFAVWCSNCLKQQQEVKALLNALGTRQDFMAVNLGVDPNEDARTVKAFIEKNGFSWTYAVAPVSLSREISRLYGDQFLNPPSTPMLIIDRQGAVHPLPFGVKSAADLKKAVEMYLQ